MSIKLPLRREAQPDIVVPDTVEELLAVIDASTGAGSGEMARVWFVNNAPPTPRFSWDEPHGMYGPEPLAPKRELPVNGDKKTFFVEHSVTYRSRLEGWWVEAPNTPWHGWIGPFDDGIPIETEPHDLIKLHLTLEMR